MRKLEKYSIEKFKLDFWGSLTAAAWIFPLALAFGANSPFGVAMGLVGAVVSCIIGSSNPQKAPSPNCAIFAVLFYAACSIGIAGSMLACVIAGMFLMFTASIQLNKYFFKIPPAALGGVTFAIAAALCITQVNNYFGIGVPDATAFDTLVAYRSFGFHANWRGVLFGTITLVVMITYPIKFKKLSKRLPASLVSIIITLPLNLLLNPSASASAVDEVGEFYRFIFHPIGEVSLFSANGTNLLPAIPFAAALIIIYFTETLLKEDKNSTIRRSLAFKGLGAVICPVCNGLVGGEMNSYGATRLTGVFSAVIIMLMTVFGHGFIVRIPTATLAVIIICVAWQSVRFSSIKAAFRAKKKFRNIAIFFVVTLLCVAWDIVYVIDIIASVALIRCAVISRKAMKAHAAQMDTTA